MALPITAPDATLATTPDTPVAAAVTEHLRALVGGIPDPEIPVVSLADLGILRDLYWAGERLRVILTPTYSGCPATEAIADEVRAVLRDAGYPRAEVKLRLAPAWTTDWISEAGRRKLRVYGIAPPAHCADARTADTLPAGADRSVTHILRFLTRPAADGPACPRCDSPNVEELSRHGSTPCKALYRCRSCREPFDYFKPY